MFTGLLPSEHGAHYIDAAHCRAEATENRSWAVWRKAGELAYPLAERNLTLAEILSAHGYATAAVIGNTGGLHRNWGLAQGFDYYDDRDVHSLGSYTSRAVCPTVRVARLIRDCLGNQRGSCRTAAEVNRDVLAWLDANPARPFLLFINYIDAHSPYESHPGFTWGGSATVSLDDQEHLTPSCKVPAEHLASVDSYDSEIAYVDAHFGELLRRLAARGLYDDALIIAVADHGEAFVEHGWLEHGKSLYEEELWVPMVIRHPGGAGAGSVEETTSIAAVFGTVLKTVGLENAVEPPCFPTALGASDERPASGLWPAAVAELWPRFNRDWTKHAGGRMCTIYATDRLKCILNTDGTFETYDLRRHTCEAIGVHEVPEAFASWAQARLLDWTAEVAAREPNDAGNLALDDALLQKLRTLGYVR
jgi:arylsulfatase A-like enzyme